MIWRNAVTDPPERTGEYTIITQLEGGHPLKYVLEYSAEYKGWNIHSNGCRDNEIPVFDGVRGVKYWIDDGMPEEYANEEII